METVITALVERMAARTNANSVVRPAATAPLCSMPTKSALVRPLLAKPKPNPAAHLPSESTGLSQPPLAARNMRHDAHPEPMSRVRSGRAPPPAFRAPEQSAYPQYVVTQIVVS